MRAASPDCTLAGMASSSTGVTRRYVPRVPLRFPASISDWTTSSVNKGLPRVRS